MEIRAMGLSRKQREHLRHRREMLEAAERVFAEKGYVSATMEEIAQQAEFAVGSLYNFFESKANLYSAVLLEKADLIGEEIRGEMARVSRPIDKIRACFRIRLSLFWKYPLFFRLMFNEVQATVLDPRAGFVPELWQRYEQFLGEIRQVFEEGVARGEFRSVEVTTMVRAFEGLIRAYGAEMSRAENPVRHRQQEADLLELFLVGVAYPEQEAG